MVEIVTSNSEKIASMIQALPEFAFKNSSTDIRSRIEGRQYTVVTARSNGFDAGFMVCYEEDDCSYYNWIMGVLPRFRRSGIGNALIRHFAEAALAAKCPRLRVKTMNKYRSMLRLLVDCHFDIVALEDGKITFESDAQQVLGVDALTRATQPWRWAKGQE